MSSANQPNVLFIVLDACRLDFASNHAQTLRRLGEEGIWFENAIAPATWTQPSHASLFTGKHPHEHGITQPSQATAPTDLIDCLAERGYTTHGVSGNGFVSPLWDFDGAFDTFRYTQTPEPFPEGMDTYTFLRNRVDEATMFDLLRSAARASVAHEHLAKSLMNFASVGLNTVARNYLAPLTRIPHQVFAPNPQYSYSPEKNTVLLQETIRRHASSDRPFFAFTNYMDTHRPYQAPHDLQMKHLGRRLSKSEFKRLNDDVAAPWEFVRLVQNDGADEADIETLRQLYAASVESVDRHLERLLRALEKNDIREETLILVLGDHGENLGETDSMGRRRFGHEASISDNLARVPLVVSHPSMERSIVDEFASLKDVYELLLRVSDPNVSTEEIDHRVLVSDRVVCEYPALADKEFYERYPNIDHEYVRQRVDMDFVAVYEDDWRVVADSDGASYAERSGDPVASDEAPSDIVEFADDVLEQLNGIQRSDVSAETTAHLDDLGYL